MVDLYAEDTLTDFQKFADAGLPWCLIALKLTQGTQYNGGFWSARMWPRARTCWGDRYGKSGFRVPYHYLDAGVDGAAQAQYFLTHLERLGGIGYGDPFVMLDVERAGQRRTLSKQQVVDCAGAWTQSVRGALGLNIVCYGGEYLRELGIKIGEFGCEYAWVADYEATLRPTHYTALGVDVAHLIGWQYAGKESATHVEAHLAGYPWTTPAGTADISALRLPGGVDTLANWCVRLPL